MKKFFKPDAPTGGCETAVSPARHDYNRRLWCTRLNHTSVNATCATDQAQQGTPV